MRLDQPDLRTDVQVFVYSVSSAFTWTKPTDAQLVHVTLIGGGGGGGSGRRGAAGTYRGGGSAGGGGAWNTAVFAAGLLPDTVAITAGRGGTGSTARTTDNTDGANGTVGGVSSFGTYLRATGGQRGEGGFNAEAASPTVDTPSMIPAARSQPYNAATTSTSNDALGAPAGGFGGFIDASENVALGNAGGLSLMSNYAFTRSTAGLPGTDSPAGVYAPGSGGGGGSPSGTLTGGAGGLYGCGGGGGAGVTNGTSSGAGGAGGHGLVVVVSYF